MLLWSANVCLAEFSWNPCIQNVGLYNANAQWNLLGNSRRQGLYPVDYVSVFSIVQAFLRELGNVSDFHENLEVRLDVVASPGLNKSSVQ